MVVFCHKAVHMFTVNSEFFAKNCFRNLRNNEITLLFTDVLKSCHSREFLK